MPKQLMLLGLLLEAPMYGQQLREAIEAHHDVFAASLKKPTMYYQLDRLVADGALEVRSEIVDAPGPGRAHAAIAPRERDVYRITEAGRRHFFDLLRTGLEGYQPVLGEVDVGVFFLHHLSPAESARLLEGRRARVAATKRRLLARIGETSEAERAAHRIVNDHTLSLIDAELAWIGRTLAALTETPAAP